MKIKVLASGSKGNATLITTENNNILIDAGITLSNAIKRTSNIPVIDTILITHTHDDHIKGLKSYIKKYKPTIYTISKELENLIEYDNINNQDTINLEDIEINLFELSHDVSCSGFRIIENKTKKELIYITDTGYLNQKILKQIKNKNMYIIESNHDTNMLMNGKYPFYLKQRIMGDKGHLSNNQASDYLKKVIGDNTKTVVLAHLSEENNTKELAYETIKKVLDDNITLIIAPQEEALETIEV